VVNGEALGVHSDVLGVDHTRLNNVNQLAREKTVSEIYRRKSKKRIPEKNSILESAEEGVVVALGNGQIAGELRILTESSKIVEVVGEGADFFGAVRMDG